MTSTALDLNHHAATATATALAIQPGQPAWDSMQLAALAQLGLADAPAGDLSVFLHVSQRTRLDPFARQIYMIGRKEKKSEKRGDRWVDIWTTKYTIQTGIEGFRVIRGRAEHDEGIRGILGRPVYYDHEGKEHKIWFQQRPPVAVEMTYTVRDRNGNATPYTSVLRYSEYVQTRDDNGNRVPIAQWAVKPVHMLEKCTEADVYRKAFPQDFSGIYLDDAMPQDTAPASEVSDGRPRGRVTAGEVLGRDDDVKASPRTARGGKAAAGDDTRSRPRSADPASAQDGQTGDRTARGDDPRAAGAAPARGAQPLPPLPGDDDEPPDPPAPGATQTTPQEPPAPAADLKPGEAAEYGTERHKKVVGIVWAHLQRLGYPDDTKETDEEKATRLADVARLAGVAEIGSTSDLDLGELSQVADTLARCKNREALDALLKAGEVDG